MLYFVAAHDQNFGIGSNTKPLPWPLMPSDKAHLHQLANGKNIAMGERTYRDYKDIRSAFRTTDVTVISKAMKTLPDAKVVDNLQTIIDRAKREDIWVIGGGSIFSQLISNVDIMQLTQIESVFEADTFFPSYKLEEWKILQEEAFPKDSQNPYPYTFLKLARK